MSDSKQRVTLAAESRNETGKGGARRVRRSGLVPAVVYSGGKEATNIAIKPLDLTRALTGPWRRNALIDLDVDGAKKSVMLKDLQKHPIKRVALHCDFVEVDLDKPISLKVPFQVTGRSAAVKAGGKVHTPRRYLNVRCKPADIPASIDLDTSDLGWGAHRASSVKMPDGVELIDDAQLTVLTISRPRGVVADEEAAPDQAAAT